MDTIYKQLKEINTPKLILSKYGKYDMQTYLKNLGIKTENGKVLNDIFPDIEKISNKGVILDMAENAFGKFMADIRNYLLKETNWHISKQIKKDGKIIGFYLFGTKNWIEKYKYLKGVQGIALYVLPEHRNLGYGKMLMFYGECLPYDYIFGLHDKGLNNEENWKRRRDDVIDIGDCYVSIKKLT